MLNASLWLLNFACAKARSDGTLRHPAAVSLSEALATAGRADGRRGVGRERAAAGGAAAGRRRRICGSRRRDGGRRRDARWQRGQPGAPRPRPGPAPVAGETGSLPVTCGLCSGKGPRQLQVARTAPRQALVLRKRQCMCCSSPAWVCETVGKTLQDSTRDRL